MERLDGKVALRDRGQPGIGAATARALAAAGVRLGLGLAERRRPGHRRRPRAVCDVRDAVALEAMVAPPSSGSAGSTSSSSTPASAPTARSSTSRRTSSRR